MTRLSKIQAQQGAIVEAFAPPPAPAVDSRIAALRAALPKIKSTDFANSLLRQYDERGSLSDKQWACVDDMVRKASAPVAPAPAVEGATKLFELFANAARGLEHPRLTFDTPVGRLTITKAAAHSANAGKLYVKLGDTYAGKLGNTGAFQASSPNYGGPSRETSASIAALLTSLCLDPVAAASVYGRKTGVCCFCARRLTDGRSVSVGYGPICAEHWGLPWGE